MNPYDQVPYHSHPQPQAHPDRLATLARLFGLRSAPLSHCRVLELACGNGSHLIPIAWSLPGSQFLGVDLAAQPIAQGQEMIRDLQLRNIRLRQADLMELTPGWEQFDYIIAHGVYSWVPAPIRQRLLEICRGCLSPTGVAYVSYNAYPGCHLRNMVREMMLFHVRGLADADECMEQAMALVHFLAAGLSDDDVYRRWLKAELEQMAQRDPGHLFHDELAPAYQPFYFTQFMAEASRSDLQFLAEADFFEMMDHPFTEPVRERLGQLSANRLLREQYLDFLKCRRFRQTLLCRKEIALADSPSPEAVRELVVASQAQTVEGPVDLAPGIPARFATPQGARAETDFALGKASLLELGEHGLAGAPFDRLLAGAQRRLAGAASAPGEDGDRLCRFLLQLYSAGVVELRSLPLACARTAAKRPLASPVVQWQIRRGSVVTSLAHTPIQVQDEIGRRLLLSLDGTRDRAALVQVLRDHLSSREPGAARSADGAESGRAVEAELEENLAKLCRMGLLLTEQSGEQQAADSL